MVTSGIKLFVGFLVASLGAAVLYGYTTGGSNVGPLSVGYKGAVGDHLGYGILLGFAVLNAALVVAHAAFRDADPAAAAEALGTDAPPAPQRPVSPSLWPVLGALGAGVLAVGLAVSPPLFWIGMAIVAAVVVEWMVEAWSDRATGDPAVNRELRDRVMTPIELPVLAFGGIAVLVLAMSRIFLTTSKEAAVWVAIGLAALIFGIAVAISFTRRVSRGVVEAVVVLGVVAALAAGIVSAAIGSRDFEVHHGEGEEEAGVEAAE